MILYMIRIPSMLPHLQLRGSDRNPGQKVWSACGFPRDKNRVCLAEVSTMKTLALGRHKETITVGDINGFLEPTLNPRPIGRGLQG